MSSLRLRVSHKADKVVTKQLHAAAGKQARQYIDDFGTTLILQAKVLAYREEAELVLKRHIDESVDFILSQKKRDWLREFLKIIGGTLIGAFAPGLITSLPANDIPSTIIYIVLGFAGMIMVFLGLSV